MADDTLERLYKIRPSAKKAIAKAAGYTVFSNLGMKILLLGGGTGKGIAVDNMATIQRLTRSSSMNLLLKQTIPKPSSS